MELAQIIVHRECDSDGILLATKAQLEKARQQVPALLSI
jgi:hypothetical protein